MNETTVKLAGASFHKGTSNQDYQTPKDFMAAVKRRFEWLSVDLAASPFNTQCVQFLSESHNSLTWDWSKLEGLLWLNPPFDNIAPWAEKCAKEAKLGAKILFLTPASVGSVWFAEHVFAKAMVFALRPRLCFDGKNPYPKDCILSCYGIMGIGFDLWKWK